LTEWYEKYPLAEAGSKKRVSLLEEAEPGDVLKDAEVTMEAESTPAKKQFSKLKSHALRPLLLAPGRRRRRRPLRRRLPATRRRKSLVRLNSHLRAMKYIHCNLCPVLKCILQSLPAILQERGPGESIKASILKDKSSILVYVLNANIEESSIFKQSDIEENTFDIKDSSILGGPHVPDIGQFSFLGALILNITLLYRNSISYPISRHIF
jgi:hypothetical protein